MRRYHSLAVLVVALALFAVDRCTKAWLVAQPDVTHVIIPGWVWLHLHLNDAMAFSLPLLPWLYYPAIVLAVVGLVVACVRAFKQQKWTEFGCTAIIVMAALSNILDRFWFGGVVDFIALPTGGVFNIADVMIIVSVLVWMITLWKHDRR